MATPEPQVQRGPGGDPNNEPLPQGAATAVNEATPPATPDQGVAPAEAPAPDLGTFQLPAEPRVPSLGTDEEKFLLGAPDTPSQVTAPQQPGVTYQQAPDWLPLLQQAALDPSPEAQATRDLFDIIASGLP